MLKVFLGVLTLCLLILLGRGWWAHAPEPRTAAVTPQLDRLLEDGQIEAARTLVQRDLEQAPESWQAWHGLAQVEIAANRLEEGLEAARRAVSLAGDRDVPPRLTLLAVQMHKDTAGALQTAEELERLGLPRDRALVLQGEATVADILQDDVVDDAEKGRIRALLTRIAETQASPSVRTALSEQEGHLLFLLGNLEAAEKRLVAPAAAPDHKGSRAASSALALAWTRFLLGDAPGAAEAYTLALRHLADGSSLRNFTGRSTIDAVLAYRLAFTGQEPDAKELDGVAAFSAALQERGLQETPAMRFNRERWRLAYDAWKRDDYPQAYLLLISRLEQYFDANQSSPVRLIQLGGQRTKVNGFFVMVDLREAGVGPAVFLGDLALRTGRREAARFWYEVAAKQIPPNPILQERMRGLPAPGEGMPEEAVPTREEALEVLARLAHAGAPLALHLGAVVPGTDLFGPSYVDSERLIASRDPVYLEFLEAVDSARAAVQSGAAFRRVDLSRPPYGVEVTDDVPPPPAYEVRDAKGRPFLMVLVDSTWMIWAPHVKLPETPEGLH